MTFWPFSKCKRVRKSPPEPSDYAITDDEIAAASVVPLEDELKAVRTDYVQAILALGRANAHTRRVLAQQTLVNVQGKMRHVSQSHV